MDYMNDRYPKLLELLENRFAMSKQYLELSEKVGMSIASDDEKTLIEALEERESLIKEIDSSNEEANEALREYEAFSEKGSGTLKADELLESTREIYVKCLTLDRKNKKEIKELIKKATDDSKELQKRREGINKYAQSDYIYAPSILDKHQ